MKPFFLGGASGLALTLAIAIGLFLSPIRKALYLEWDPELAGLRSKTDQIRQQVTDSELDMAAESSVESRRAAQAGAWKEYKHWRNRLGELSRAHDAASASDFPAWAYSLRYGLLPLAAFLSLVPALFFGIRSARRPSPARLPASARPARAAKEAATPAKAAARPAPVPAPAPAAETLSAFQSAVKQVARIATPDLPPAARPVAQLRASVPAPLPAADEAAQEPSPYEVESGNVFRIPETETLPLTGNGSAGAARPEAAETQIFQLGPGGWGEPRPAEEPPASRSDVDRGRPGDAGALSMEDEDGVHSQDEQAGTGTQGAFMPPTTEVERVERRKAEVLKLARKGLTSSEISRRLRISQDQVEFIIRMRREKG